MSKTYEETLKKKRKDSLIQKRHVRLKPVFMSISFQRTCGLFPFITSDRVETIIFSPCLKLFSGESA